MSELIVIGYDDKQPATEAYDEILALNKDFVVTLAGLAIVTVDEDGKTHVDTPQRIVSSSAMSGALWGMLMGILFFVPGVGILFGGAMGALLGTMSKAGIDDEFRSKVDELLSPGKSAVVVMATKITEDKFAAALAPFGGTILKTSLSVADEKELADELSGGAAPTTQ